MSGEGAAVSGIGSFAEIIDRMQAGKPLFDMRPGLFEATRGLDAVPVAVAARHDLEGWHVQLLADGVVLARLSIEEAHKLAADIVATAEIAAGNWS